MITNIFNWYQIDFSWQTLNSPPYAEKQVIKKKFSSGLPHFFSCRLSIFTGFEQYDDQLNYQRNRKTKFRWKNVWDTCLFSYAQIKRDLHFNILNNCIRIRNFAWLTSVSTQCLEFRTSKKFLHFLTNCKYKKTLRRSFRYSTDDILEHQFM